MNLGGGGAKAGGLQYCVGGGGGGGGGGLQYGGGGGGDGGGRGGDCWLHGLRQGHSPHFMLGLIEFWTVLEYVALVAMGMSITISI